MKKIYYPAKFSKEKTADGIAYNVEFIDFPEAFTYGYGMEEAYFMAQDVLFIAINERKILPKVTTDFSSIKLEKNEFISLVELDIEEHNKKVSKKTVSTTVTMPEWLKVVAEKNDINFSKILQNAIKNELYEKKMKFIER